MGGKNKNKKKQPDDKPQTAEAASPQVDAK